MYVLIISILFVSVFGLFLFPKKVPCGILVGCPSLNIGNTHLRVSLRTTPEQQEQGLSGTWYLFESTGMFFVFPEVGEYSFWMKDMNYSIDMIWISADKQVVAISENATPESYPAKFTSPVPVKYVLEVRAGWAKRHDVNVGDIVSWDTTEF